MDVNKILKSDILDLLFEGREKTYGAYELRRNYPRRVRNATIVAVLVVGSALAAPLLASKLKPKEDKPALVMKEVNLAEPPPIDPKKPPPPPPVEPPPPVKPTVKFTPPVVKKDEEVKEEERPPEVKEMEKADPGLKTVEGDPNALDPGIVEPDKGKGAVEEKKESEVFTYVEQEPTFPGGEDAMMAFLGRNIKYPPQAKEAGIEGQVVVQFIVNEDGDISDVKVVRSVAGGCDAEAMRVVKSMPKWKPGKQNGRAVRVLYNLPIRFKLES